MFAGWHHMVFETEEIESALRSCFLIQKSKWSQNIHYELLGKNKNKIIYVKEELTNLAIPLWR